MFRGKRKRVLYLLALLPLLSLLVTHSFSQIATPTPNIELGTGTAFEFLTFGTYLTWSNTIYAQSVAYYPNQINFTDASYGNTSGPTLTFGLASEYSNSTITGIASNSLGLSTGPVGFGSSYSLIDFCFASSMGSPEIIYVNSTAGNTQIPSSKYYTNYSQFSFSPSPSAFVNSSGSLVEVKLAESSSLLFYYNSATATSTSLSSSSSSTTSASSTTGSSSYCSTFSTQSSGATSSANSSSSSSSSSHSSTGRNNKTLNAASPLASNAFEVGIVTYEMVLTGGVPVVLYYMRRKSITPGRWRW